MCGRRALLIANPVSGLGRTRRVAAALVRALAVRELDVDLTLTPQGSAAARAVQTAVAGGCRRIIVAGGDGTVNSVLGAMAHTGAALGVIPTGMANAFARELGIPLACGPACDIAAGRCQRRIDLARAGRRHFAVMAGIGFDADVVRRINPRLKRRTGPAAYVLAGLGRLLRFTPARVTLRWDEGEVVARALMVLAANTAHYTYGWRIATDARVDDGLLEVVLFRCDGALDSLAHVASVLTGLRRRHRLMTVRTRRLRVECEPSLAVHTDGDLAGVTPVEIESLPRALKVLVSPERCCRER